MICHTVVAVRAPGFWSKAHDVSLIQAVTPCEGVGLAVEWALRAMFGGMIRSLGSFKGHQQIQSHEEVGKQNKAPLILQSDSIYIYVYIHTYLHVYVYIYIYIYIYTYHLSPSTSSPVIFARPSNAARWHRSSCEAWSLWEPSPWRNGKTIGKSWEHGNNYRKTMGIWRFTLW